MLRRKITSEQEFKNQLVECMNKLSLVKQESRPLKINNFQTYFLLMAFVASGISLLIILMRTLVTKDNQNQITENKNTWESKPSNNTMSCKELVDYYYPYFENRKRYVRACSGISSAGYTDENYKNYLTHFRVLPAACFKLIKDFCDTLADQKSQQSFNEWPEILLIVSLTCMLAKMALNFKNTYKTKTDLTDQEVDALINLLNMGRLIKSTANKEVDLIQITHDLSHLNFKSPSERQALYAKCLSLLNQIMQYEFSIETPQQRDSARLELV